MLKDSEDLGAAITNQLAAILSGQFRMTLKEIEEIKDPGLAEIYAGLYFLNEDLEHQRRETFEAQAARDAAMQAALHRSEQRFDLLMSQFHGLLWIIDADLSIISASRHGAAQKRLDGVGIIGEPLSALLDGNDPIIHACQRARRGAHSTLDWRWERRIYQVTVSPYAWSPGAPVGAAVVAFDVTEQRQLEHRTQEAARLEALGLLAGGVAHDFNNLLTIIQSYTSLLHSGGDCAGESLEDLEQILEASSRAATLVQQLLAFGRRQFRSPEIIDLSEVLTELHAMLQRVLPEDITLSLQLQEGVGRVHMDRTQLEQVLMNLAINARDAMPNGGALTIEVSPLCLVDPQLDSFGLEPGSYALISISDTGSGMDQETQARIFEPFFSTKGALGTGLGLATVYGIVSQSRGDITVHSEVNQGSTFRLYLPTTERAPTLVEEHPKAQPTHPRSLSILFVDDERGLRQAIYRILKLAGHAVTIASGPKEALSLTDRWGVPPDLLITDVIMPEMNGRQLAEAFHLRWPDLPVLYISGYSENVVVKRGVLIEGTHLLTKPFTPSQLHQMISRVLEAR